MASRHAGGGGPYRFISTPAAIPATGAERTGSLKKPSTSPEGRTCPEYHAATWNRIMNANGFK